MGRRRGVSAWLIEWQWAGEHARYEGRNRYHVVSPRFGAKYVADVMERIYATESYTIGEQVSLAAGRWENPYKADIEHFERIHCGHNPYLYGRRVRNLRAEDGDDGEEVLRWDEIEIPQEWWDRLERIRAQTRQS